jgi:protein-disulfide isomerase
MAKKMKFYIGFVCVTIFIGYQFFKADLTPKEDTRNVAPVTSIANNVSKIIENNNLPIQEQEVVKEVEQPNVIDMEIDKNEILTVRDNDFLLGNPDAKVQIIQYSSLTCPACKYYQTAIFEKLRKDYIDTGKVVYVAREFPFDKAAYQAAILARCGGKEKYYTFLNVLFKNQESWAYRKNYQELLANIGQLGGVGAEEFAVCINDPLLNQTVEQNNFDARSKLKLLYAPAIFINGVMVESEVSHNYDLLSQKIKEHLDK